ncbi:MAG: hypothetical protein KC996_02225 [Phycisphaerales bacterium]|nr:hypothetical protein [Phycisphaerales bacterium]
MESSERRYPETSELTIVVRAAGERTEQACTEIMRRGLKDPAQCTVIHEKPFSAAVRRTLEIGRDSGRPWLIAVDADLLPLADVLLRVREVCGKMAVNAYCATPLFLCKTMAGLATRGLHIYRAPLLGEALSVVPNKLEPLRPESAIQDTMMKRGYTRECYAKIFGLHEFEQSYRHIYIKTLLRARKEPDLQTLSDRLEIAAESDSDAMVSLWAIEDALQGEQPPEYDWSAQYPRFEERMREHSMSEKPAMSLQDIDGFVRSAIRAHDFVNDRSTLPWVRELLGFGQGAADALAYVDCPPLASTGVGS